MSTEIYRYNAPNGQRISVLGAGKTLDAVHLSAGLAAAPAITPVRDKDVPEVARGILAAMHEAAGLDVPFILDRPEIDGTATRNIFGTTFAVSHYPGNVRFGADEPGGHMLNMRPAQAAALAGILMAHADAAAEAREPDPADVYALARVLERAGVSEYHPAALAALRAGYTPPGRKAVNG